jgi:hypothetical protein
VGEDDLAIAAGGVVTVTARRRGGGPGAAEWGYGCCGAGCGYEAAALSFCAAMSCPYRDMP